MKSSLCVFILLFGSSTAVFATDLEDRVHVKVVVATMFERGESRGDTPGELQHWVERLELGTEYPFPLGEDVLYMNDDGVLAILTGGGIPNATASIMALGVDPRFDLSSAYWLIAGIAGGDPEDLSLGSAAWARHVVDGDLAYEIDGREIPDHWPYGMIPLGAKEPATLPRDLATTWTLTTIAFDLNKPLAEWAYSITRDLELPDAPGIAAYRKAYKGHPQAQRPPFVAIGDTLSSSTYWHGALLNEWANDWVPLYAGEDASFMTSNMEDSGTLTALHRLGRMQLVACSWSIQIEYWSFEQLATSRCRPTASQRCGVSRSRIRTMDCHRSNQRSWSVTPSCRHSLMAGQHMNERYRSRLLQKSNERKGVRAL